jgi:thiamine biosynthesis lipoprotein
MKTSKALIRARLAEGTLTRVGRDYYEIIFQALGARCQFIYEASNYATAEDFRDAAFDWLSDFEARFSRFLPASDLSAVNAAAGRNWVDVDRQCDVLLDLCQHCHFLTNGAFDATSLPLTCLWDWKQKHDALPTVAEIAQAQSVIGWSRVQRTPGRLFLPVEGMMLDFGGVGKEFAVDCLKELGANLGVQNLLIDLGGDIAVLGDSPEGDGWYVRIEDPRDPTTFFCGVRLRSGSAVATSGNYRRCFVFEGRTYGHILDCRTGWPVDNGTRAVTVIAPRCVLAGMLSTSAMVIGGSDAIATLERTVGVEGCLWHRDNLYETRGFRRAVLAKELLADR